MTEVTLAAETLNGSGSLAALPGGVQARGFARPHVPKMGTEVPGLTIDLVDGEVTPADQDTVSVIVPTLNEAGNIRTVFERIPAWIDELIVVDGGSTDETVEIVREVRPDAKIIGQDRKGKGNALVCGFDAASCDIIVMIDADGSTDPAEIPRYVSALRSGADYAKGSRFVTGGGSSDITLTRKLGNRVLCFIVNSMFGSDYSDLCYGYNAFYRRHLTELGINCTGFEVETLMNIRAARRELRVIEVPSFEAERLSGASNLSAIKDGIRVLRTILSERISVS